MLHDFLRRPVVIAVVVDRIEDVDTSREMQRSDGTFGVQFEVRWRGVRLGCIGRAKMTVATARSKKQCGDENCNCAHLGEVYFQP